MCVIIHKPKDVVLPYDLIESAWTSNRDGFGATFVDRGKYQIRKILDTTPEKVIKFLEETSELDVACHLRFNTKGETSQNNLHPFPVLSPKKDGRNLHFYHNGTLRDLGNTKVSDSNEFNQTVLKPLARLMLKSDPDITTAELLTNPLAKTIIDKYRGASSVFLFYGENGELLKVGGGVDHKDGWWSSNDHYFRKSRLITDKATAPYNSSHYNGAGPWADKTSTGSKKGTYPVTRYVNGIKVTEDVPYSNAAHKAVAEKDEKKLLPFSKEVTTPAYGSLTTGKGSKEDISKTVSDTSDKKPPTLPKLKPTDRAVDFLSEVDDLEELLSYSQESVERLVKHHPFEASLVIKDLLNELYWETYEYEDEELVDSLNVNL